MDESLRMEQALRHLADLILRHAPSSGTFPTSVPNLSLMNADHLSEPLESVYKPSLCLVAQGAKTATLGDETYRYDPMTFVVIAAELPIISKIVEASPEVPYLSLKLSFDPDVILDIVKESSSASTSPVDASPGITMNRTSPGLLEAAVRLVQLLDTPGDIPVLAPLIVREILYRVLQSEHGSLIRSFAMVGSHSHNIAQAIRMINRQYAEPLVIEQLAKEASLSTSAFHKHFKRVTSMSPLQYQKTLRLQEARRLMLTETVHASEAAFLVGYESPSQFSREYARMYGRPPMLDIQEQRASAITGP
ncbi:AraC family transcriptional regulator [Paenibacillus sp. ATY16]|uniref:AraC family transcriptional regulator n=1 Tax=Paenibacillus sp. ATY16 TaxID=1759312 RepID=UPI000E2F81FB|nr:AraC family transcriptional regulator [Paenibacillus sp. ATY16]MCK9861734.1 AraC family transcriptional regulator [Paenibacillus sp. ATY16]